MIVLFIFSLCTLADIPSCPRSFKNINEHSYKSNESRQWPTSGIRPAIWSMTLWNHLSDYTIVCVTGRLAHLPSCTWGPNKDVFDVCDSKKCHTLHWHATLNLFWMCKLYKFFFPVCVPAPAISFKERATASILSPIQYFPHFPAGTQFPASYLKWMAAAANKFSRFPLNSRHLKIPPPTQNKKLPTWTFSTDPIWNILRQIIRSFHFICNEMPI